MQPYWIPILYYFLNIRFYTEVSADRFLNIITITEIGKANLVRTGTDISIITYGAGVHWALSLAESKTGDFFSYSGSPYACFRWIMKPSVKPLQKRVK